MSGHPDRAKPFGDISAELVPVTTDSLHGGLAPTMKHHKHLSRVTLPDDPDALLREEQAAALLGFTPRALQDWRMRGSGPRFVRISARAVRYRRADLFAWAESLVRSSTAEV